MLGFKKTEKKITLEEFIDRVNTLYAQHEQKIADLEKQVTRLEGRADALSQMMINNAGKPSKTIVLQGKEFNVSVDEANAIIEQLK